MERTVVLAKPDAIGRGISLELLASFERKGLRLVACKMMALTSDLLDEHYQHVASEPFFPALKSFMMSTPILATCWEGRDAIEAVRGLCGGTCARKANPGTLRGDYAMSVQTNLLHASDSAESAKREIDIFFGPTELFGYVRVIDSVIYAPGEEQAT